MNDFLRAQYEQARQASLQELAAMQQRNDEYAEKNGGAENLPEQVRRTYEARKNTIIRLVMHHDRTHEYIEDLQDWIAQLIRENRELAARAADQEQGWRKYFPNMTNPHQTESHREHQRQISFIRAKIAQPELF